MKVTHGLFAGFVVGAALCAQAKDILSDTARIRSLTGMKGAWNAKEGVYKVASPRTDLPIAVDGFAMPPFMGLTSWAAFAGKDDAALVDGDFAMREEEMQGVLKALRKAGINIVAIHHHMIEEKPRILFLHYWGKGKALDLAKGIKAALDTQPKD